MRPLIALVFLVLVYVIPGQFVLRLIAQSVPGLSSLVLTIETATDLDASYLLGALVLFLFVAALVYAVAGPWLVARPQDRARLACPIDGHGLGSLSGTMLVGIPLYVVAALVLTIANRPNTILTGPLFVLMAAVWWGSWQSAHVPAVLARVVAHSRPVLSPTGMEDERRTFRWTFNRRPYLPQKAPIDCIAELRLSQNEYDKRHSESREFDHLRWDQYVRQVSVEVAELAMQFTRIRAASGLCAYEEIANVLTFSQPPTIEYAVDGTQERPTEWPKYPIETLWEGRGDCEDHSILAAAILRRLGYDVALLFMSGHAALGVAGADGLPGRYVRFNNHSYYYCETTGSGWKVGELPTDLTNANMQIVPIISEAVDPPGTLAESGRTV